MNAILHIRELFGIILIVYHFHLFFLFVFFGSIKFPQQNISQSETRFDDIKLPAELYVMIRPCLIRPE